MPRELEAKHRVESLVPVRTALERLGATMELRCVEWNQIFDTPEGRLKDRRIGLRLRTLDRAETPTGAGVPCISGGATLTFKGPPERSAYKSREEVEVVVNHPAGMVELLGGLGFIRVLGYAKRREHWRLGECHVELDELPQLGCFVEVEGPSEQAIDATRQQCGLTACPLVRESYVGLVSSHLSNLGNLGRELRFDTEPAL